MVQIGIDADDPEVRILKIYKIVRKRNVQLSNLGPAVVEGGIKKQLMARLAELIPYGPCLFDWKIERHVVDELDEAGQRWPDALEGDMIIQGYLRYQIPELEDGL